MYINAIDNQEYRKSAQEIVNNNLTVLRVWNTALKNKSNNKNLIIYWNGKTELFVREYSGFPQGYNQYMVGTDVLYNQIPKNKNRFTAWKKHLIDGISDVKGFLSTSL